MSSKSYVNGTNVIYYVYCSYFFVKPTFGNACITIAAWTVKTISAPFWALLSKCCPFIKGVSSMYCIWGPGLALLNTQAPRSIGRSPHHMSPIQLCGKENNNLTQGPNLSRGYRREWPLFLFSKYWVVHHWNTRHTVFRSFTKILLWYAYNMREMSPVWKVSVRESLVVSSIHE